MLRIGRIVLAQAISSYYTSPVSQLHRLLSAAAPHIFPNPSFAVEDYLVGTCGLTRAQALKASTKISHIESPTNPDAVLAFLAGLGLSGADVAALIAKDPQLLCANVEKTLSPVVAGLAAHGLSHTEIAHLVSFGLVLFRCRSIVSNLMYYMSLLGSIENRVRFLKQGSGLLGCSLEKVVKPNVAFLRNCGLGDCDISKLCLSMPRVLSYSPERIQAMVACAEGLGVPRGSAMFKHGLHAVAFLTEEKIAAHVENLKNMFRWSDAEVRIALCRDPLVLTRSKDILQRKSEFLIRPRYYVLKLLKEKGLVHQNRDYYSTLMISDKVFMEKFICPHKEAAPHLAEDYTAACRGEVPTRFRST